MLLLAACGKQNSKAKYVFASQVLAKLPCFWLIFLFKFC
jgi:hypothetical protein